MMPSKYSGDKLSLTLWVYPRSLSSSAGTLITKGNWQFGIRQVNNEALEFYVTTRQKQTVKIPLPENWIDNWHHVTAHYDGSAIFISIDDAESEHIPLTGNIRNTPFPGKYWPECGNPRTGDICLHLRCDY